MSTNWERVSIESEVDSEGNCGVCGDDVSECGCPRLGMNEYYEYLQDKDGRWWARKKDDCENYADGAY